MVLLPNQKREWRWVVILLPPILLASLALRLANPAFYPFIDEIELVLGGQVMGISGSVHPMVANYPPLIYYLQLGVISLLGLFGWAPTAMAGLEEVATKGLVEGNSWLVILRIISGVIGTATVALVVLLGRRLWGEREGLWAGLFFAVSPLFVAVSRVASTDVPSTFFILLALLLAAEGAAREKGFKWLVISGLVAGLAAGAKYYGGMVVLAPLTMACFSPIGRRSGGVILRHAVIIGLASLVGMLLVIPGMLTNPGHYLAWLGNHAGDAEKGWEFFRGYPKGWFFHPLVTFRWGLGGPAGAVLGLGGVVVLLFRQVTPRRLFLGFAAGWFILVGYSGVLYSRYWTAFLPLLCLGAAWAGMVMFRRRRWLGHLLLTILVGSCLFHVVPQVIALKRIDTRVQAGEWLRQRTVLGTSLATMYPLYQNAKLTALLQQEINSRQGAVARAAFLGQVISRDPTAIAHLGWDTTYPLLDPALFQLEYVATKDSDKLACELADLRAKGVSYYLWTSFRDGIIEECGPGEFPARNAFLRDLRQLCGKPVARFFPGPADPRIPLAELENHVVQAYHPERPGPEIRIYAIPGR